MKYGQLHPCGECPFRKASIRGWLGENTGDAEETINEILGLRKMGNVFIGCEPVDFDCHVSTKNVLDAAGIYDGYVPEESRDKIQHCVGAMLMLKARCKRPRDIVKSAMMDKVSATEPMILNREEFIRHHTLKVKRGAMK